MGLQHKVVTHFRPDDDEFVAIRILELWGSEEFPGVERNPLITVDAGLRLEADEIGKWLTNGYVPVGVGGPLADLDEHGRGDGKSAASMAAVKYGITEDEALKPILDYSLRADDKALDHPYNVATLVKTLHAAGVELETVRVMHRRWFDSLYLYFGGALVFADVRRSSFRQMAVAWLVGTYGTAAQRSLVFGTFADAMAAIEVPAGDADELADIQRFVDRDYDAVGYNPFDLAGLVRVMQCTGARDEDILKDVAAVLDAKVRTQRDFNTALRYFQQSAAYLDDAGRVALVRSDNEQMQKAARRANPDLAILVQRRIETGRIQIFSDNRRDLRPILARLRALEYRRSRRRGQLSHRELYSAGTNPKVSNWYGFEKEGIIISIFNGSLKTRETRRTRLTEPEVVACVREALPHIHRARGVKRDRRDNPSPATTV